MESKKVKCPRGYYTDGSTADKINKSVTILRDARIARNYCNLDHGDCPEDCPIAKLITNLENRTEYQTT